MSKTQELRAQFTTITLKLTRAQRLECSEEIKSLSSHLGIKEDLTADRRSMNWKPGGKARDTIDNKKTHKVAWRQGGSVEVTLDEAAQIFGVSKNALSIRLTRSNGTYHKTVEDGSGQDIITVSKIV